MNNEEFERQVSRRSASIYLPVAMGASLAFFLVTSLVGNYPPVAKIGGTIWIGLLSLIVSMPLVTAWVKRKHKR